MDKNHHWEHVYETKSIEKVSWYRPHLETSLDWIMEAAPGFSAAVIDVGGGASTLADDLYAKGFRSLTVMDISRTAIEHARARLRTTAPTIHWIVGDITSHRLPHAAFDIWHDRAVFHFLTRPEERAVYKRQLAQALKPSGSAILATFSLNGPQSCSGLPVNRYDAVALQQEFSPEFRLVRSATLQHQTPSGSAQEFLYCQMERI